MPNEPASPDLPQDAPGDIVSAFLQGMGLGDYADEALQRWLGEDPATNSVESITAWLKAQPSYAARFPAIASLPEPDPLDVIADAYYEWQEAQQAYERLKLAVRSARDREISLARIAEACGVTKSTVQRWATSSTPAE